MRSIIVHDWLISGIGGSEKVLEAIHRLFPSPIYTLVKDGEALKNTYFENVDITPSFIQRLPKASRKYQRYLPLFPLAIEHFDVTSFDVVISSSHCAAKGVITGPGQVHICYCHTPMRYAWDLMYEYLRESKLDRGLKGWVAKCCLHYLRGWDVHSSHRVDHFIANSHYVAKRIEKFYGRKAAVIYPGVDIDDFPEKKKKDSYYLAASRLVPYKRIDLIVEAFSHMPQRKLVVIGEGPEFEKVKKKASSNVELLGFQSHTKLLEYMQNARSFVFAALEDFGILPVEAMAAGTPVIAFGKGGALETVVASETGLFFREQTVASLIEAVEAFERMDFDSGLCRKRAEEFSLKKFNHALEQFVMEKT